MAKLLQKVYIMALCLLTITMNLYAQDNQHKKIGLVLAGGGAKGVAHIGALKVIEESGIPIDYITGTSMGALIGALYSIGYSASELDSLVRTQDWTTLLSDKIDWKDRSQFYKMYGNVYTISLPMGVNRGKKKRSIEIPAGFIKGQNISNLFSELTIGYHSHIPFDSLPIPFACVATNISTGKPYVFREGILQEAMRASMSIPGAFEPVLYKDSLLLVDGGVVNNFPADVAKEMGADLLIGIDLDNGFKEQGQIHNVVDIFEQLNEMLGYDSYTKNKELLDIHIHPNLKEYSIASFTNEAIDSMIAIGERCARNNWDKLIELKKRAGYEVNSQASPQHIHKLAPDDMLVIRKIEYHGAEESEKHWIHKIMKLNDSSLISPQNIQEAIKKIYATGNYSQITYALEGDGPYDLHFTLERRPPRSINLGFRFDSEVYAALLLNTTLRTPRAQATQLSISGRLGENPWGEFGISFGDGFLNRLDIGYRIQYNDYHLYYKGKRLAPIVNLNHRAYINLANISRGHFNFQAGLRYDYYDYRDILALRDTIKANLHGSGSYVTYHASLQYNNLENHTFPRSGMLLKLNYNLITSNFVHLNGHSPAHIINYKYKHIVRLTNSVKFIPQIDGRVIFKEFDQTPIPFVNYIGGSEDGRYTEQQISMPGIKFTEIAQNSVLKLSGDIRYNIGRGHYAEAGAAYMQNKNTFKEMIRSKGMWGMKVSYAYNALFGPITVTYSTCDEYWKNAVYISVGYYF